MSLGGLAGRVVAASPSDAKVTGSNLGMSGHKTSAFLFTFQLFTAISPLLVGAWTSPGHKMNEVFDYEQTPFRYQGFNSFADSARPTRRKEALEQEADGDSLQDKILQKFFNKQQRYKERGSKLFQNGVISDYKIKEQLRPQLFQRANSEDRIEVRPKSTKKEATLDDTIKQFALKRLPNRMTLDDGKVNQYRPMWENRVTLSDRKEKQERPNVFSNRNTLDQRLKKKQTAKSFLNQVTPKDKMEKHDKPKSVKNRMTLKDRTEKQQRPNLSQSRESLKKRMKKQKWSKMLENRYTAKDRIVKKQPAQLFESQTTLEDRTAKQQQTVFENGTASEGRINEDPLEAATKKVMRRIAKKLMHVRRARSRGPFGITGLRSSRNAPGGTATGSATACPEGQVMRGGVCSCPYLSSWNSASEKCECAYGTYEDQYGYCRSFF